MEILSIEGLRKVYGMGESAVTALEDIHLRVAAGQLVALLGPSGSGKTTLLLCVSLILEPTAGTVTMSGQDVYRDGKTITDPRRLRRENIGFIFQGQNLIPFLSARENVVLAMNLNRLGGKQARLRADDLLQYLDVAHRSNALPANLSGGEQQRVAIARALANEPKLILADEPTASLDTERGMKVMGLLKKIARERNSAVIAVTHDERMVADFDVVYRLGDGRLQANGKSQHPRPEVSP